jgi:hypothetical protein
MANPIIVHDMPPNFLRGPNVGPKVKEWKKKNQGMFLSFVNPTDMAMHGSFNFRDCIRDIGVW